MWVEIFASGTWTDGAKKTRTWSPEEVSAVAARYNAEYPTHQAPAVLGHPQHDPAGRTTAPALGWLESAKAEDDPNRIDPETGKPRRVMYGQFKQLYKPFEEAIAAGLWKNRSVYIRDGQLMHVGWLGERLPAVGVLADPTIQQAMQSAYAVPPGPEGETVYAENPNPAPAVASPTNAPTAMDAQQFQQMMDALKAISDDMKKLMESVGPGSAPADKATPPGADSEATAALATAAAAQNAALVAQVTELTRQVQDGQFSAWLDSDDVRKRVTPKLRDGVLTMLRTLAEAQAAAPEGTYAQGQSPLDLYRAQILAMPEIAPPGGHFASAHRANTDEVDPTTDLAKSIVAARSTNNHVTA